MVAQTLYETLSATPKVMRIDVTQMACCCMSVGLCLYCVQTKTVIYLEAVP